MNIAIQAADLDAERIDGTRVYISELLRRFGTLGPEHTWHLYHRTSFNPELAPPELSNYTVHQVDAPFSWTQTRFAYEMWKLRPERLWMPVQALPFVLPKGVQTIVTIHDLAFKYFPEHFPAKDLRRLNWFADFSIRKADKLIAVSESTKRDILKFYPEISESKIRVIYHGFSSRFTNDTNGLPQISANDTLKDIRAGDYILYVGAIQPRKNLSVLLDAFGLVKKAYPDMKLVLAGEKAWQWEPVIAALEKHPFREDVILTGKVSFDTLAELYRGARMFVFPSLYEGFGIPVLEAQAAGVPVVCAGNSSLPEVGGDAALYFDASDSKALAEHMGTLWSKENVREELVRKGFLNTKKFSWDKCASETYEWIINEV